MVPSVTLMALPIVWLTAAAIADAFSLAAFIALSISGDFVENQIAATRT